VEEQRLKRLEVLKVFREGMEGARNIEIGMQ
jgi:hypothetical protein